MNREPHSLGLVPRLPVGEQGRVLGLCQVGPQLGPGREPGPAAIAPALVNLPPDEVDQLHLLVEIQS